MCVPRLEALRWLSKYIQAQIPELKDVICTVVGAPGHQLAFPSLAITPVIFTYEPNQAVETYAVYPDKVTMAVGNYRGILQLRLTTDTEYQRYAIEEKLTQLFLSREGGPGVLVGEITSCAELGEFTADFEFDSVDWINDEAMKNKYVSLIVVTSVIPALTVRRDAHVMDQLLVGTEIGQGDNVDLPLDGELAPTSDDIDAEAASTDAPTFDETGVTDPTGTTDLGTITEEGVWELIT